MLDDARGLVVRAADEAEAVGQQRQAVHPVRIVVLEGAQDGAVVDVEELDGGRPRRRARAGCRAAPRGRSRAGVQLRRCSGGCRRGATRGRCTSVPPLRKRLPSGITATAQTDIDAFAGAHEALAGDAPHIDFIIPAADDVLPVARHRHRVHRAGVPLEGVDERPVDVVQPCRPCIVVAPAKADHKVHAVGQRRGADRHSPQIEGALECAVERPQLCGAVVPALTKRAPPGSTATALMRGCWMRLVRFDGALARAVAPHLDGAVIRAGDDAAVGHRCHAPNVGARERDDLARERPQLERELRSVAEQAGTSAPLQRCRGRAAAGRARGPARPPAARVSQERRRARRRPRRASCWHRPRRRRSRTSRRGRAGSSAAT